MCLTSPSSNLTAWLVYERWITRGGRFHLLNIRSVLSCYNGRADIITCLSSDCLATPLTPVQYTMARRLRWEEWNSVRAVERPFKEKSFFSFGTFVFHFSFPLGARPFPHQVFASNSRIFPPLLSHLWFVLYVGGGASITDSPPLCKCSRDF